MIHQLNPLILMFIYYNSALDGYLVKLEAELQELDKSIQEEQMKLNAEKASVLRSEKDVSLVISNFGKKR